MDVTFSNPFKLKHTLLNKNKSYSPCVTADTSLPTQSMTTASHREKYPKVLQMIILYGILFQVILVH